MPRPTDGLAWSLRMNSLPDITQTPFGNRRPSVRVWPWARPAYTEGSRLTNPEAEDLYLKGRYYWNKRTPDDLNKAVDLFTQAIVHDPGYAKAYAGLADTYNLLREFSLMPSNQAFSRSLAAPRSRGPVHPGHRARSRLRQGVCGLGRHVQPAARVLLNALQPGIQPVSGGAPISWTCSPRPSCTIPVTPRRMRAWPTRTTCCASSP